MFSNKHVITALIVTPILALIAYFAVDMAVSEKPQQAQRGASYPLAAKSNCRYSSGLCSLVNGDVRIELSAVSGQLMIKTSHAAEGLQVAIARQDGSEQLLLLQQNNDAQQWLTTLPDPFSENNKLRIAANIEGSTYFNETALAFIQYETGFDSSDMGRRE